MKIKLYYFQKYSWSNPSQHLNPSNDEATFAKAQGRKPFWKRSKPCHIGIHWKALAEYCQMSTHVPGFQFFFSFLHHLVLAKLATSSIRVKNEIELLSKIFLFPTIVVLIWEYSVRAIQWIPTWQGVDVCQKSLCSCALAKVALALEALSTNNMFVFWTNIHKRDNC